MVKAKYKELLELFVKNDLTVGWDEVPKELENILWYACLDGLIVSMCETDSYFMPNLPNKANKSDGEKLDSPAQD